MSGDQQSQNHQVLVEKFRYPSPIPDLANQILGQHLEISILSKLLGKFTGPEDQRPRAPGGRRSEYPLT